MRDNASFIRKVVYLILIALLLIPLYLISSPAFINPSGQVSEGGLLTRERQKHGLSQANLGEIDPASESMKLALLGMRGVAANLMWERANEYKKKEQWDNLRATLNQIAKLQPNFISVWQFQAWNLSYNVSVEFDNYEHRYEWVKKGIDFLQQGIRYNRNEPRLLWDAGWFFGHKFGRSDEYRQFRREYREDSDFHNTLPIDIDAARGIDNKPDNWLTAFQWFREAQRVVDKEGVPIRGKNPLVFHSDSPKALIRYGDAIEEEGVFGEQARLAWRNAHMYWSGGEVDPRTGTKERSENYGDREIPTSHGYTIRLNEGEKWNERLEQRQREMEEFLPGLKQQLIKERMEGLTVEELQLLARPKRELNAEEYEIVTHAEEKVEVTPSDVVAAAPREKRRQARYLANRIQEANAYAVTIRRYRDIVNFIYWRTRCEVEKQDYAILARQYLYEADQAYRNADLEGAREKYEAAWERWAKIHNENPVLAEDVTAEDLVEPMKRYRTLLGQLDEEFPPPGFQMLRLLAGYADEFGLSDEEADAMLAEADAMDAAADGEPADDEPSAFDAIKDEAAPNEAAHDDTSIDDTTADDTTADDTPDDNTTADDATDGDATDGDGENGRDLETAEREPENPDSADDQSAPGDDGGSDTQPVDDGGSVQPNAESPSSAE